MGIALVFPLIAAFIVRLPLVETWALSSITVTLLALPLRTEGALGLTVLSLLVSLAIFFLFRNSRPKPTKSEYLVLGIFLFSVFAVYQACLLWPDFIAMGERLRDYAVLSSVRQSPIIPREPWMEGSPLNYYIFWYRYGATLGTVLNLPVWTMYHLLQAITLSIYFVAVSLIFLRIANFSLLGSFFSGLLITFGSNISGVIHAFTQNESWWGPSRVVGGAINEFPAWSFLLGDLHPHYLNLPAIPLFLLVSFYLWNQNKILALLFTFALVPLFMYGANAWEVPICLIINGSIFVMLVAEPGFLKNINLDQKTSIWLFILAFALLATYLQGAHINTLGDSFDLVRDPIKRTQTLEAFLHWGLPLGIYAVWALFSRKELLQRILIAGLALVSLTLQEIAPFLTLILALLIIEDTNDNSINKRFIKGIELSSIFLILLGEIVFMNDAYGGEHERMNTIFKIYSSIWATVHIGAFYRLSQLPIKGWILKSLAIVCGAALLSFTIFTSTLRYQKETLIEPRSQGLSAVEREFPGAGKAIQALEKLERGTVIEAQGNAYSYTSFVCTLSGNSCFLGWANHIGLLLKKHDEVRRREDFTKEIYSGTLSCELIRQKLKSENIKYLVYGTLEKRNYPGEKDFGCLEMIINEGDYQIYKTESVS
jgi:uncharacterized membrane protein